MNGIHDLGGMTCFGPVQAERNEPVFHADWERRVFAMNVAALAFFGPVDRARHAVERINPVDYLSSSYYENWLAGIEIMGRELGYLSDEEIASGRVLAPSSLPYPAPDATKIEGLVRGGASSMRDADVTPSFAVGDRVRARNIETPGHTRLPRYVRGREGVIVRYQGVHVFADSMAHDQGEQAQPLYCVRFEARELWGDNVDRRDCLFLDLWQSYLEPAHDDRRPA